MDYNLAKFGLIKPFEEAGTFETVSYKAAYDAIKTAVHKQSHVMVTGQVGTGKTKLLRRIKAELNAEKKILTATVFALDLSKVTIASMMYAVILDARKTKNRPVPGKKELKNFLIQTITQNKTMTVLFIDDAHQLSNKAVTDLISLSELFSQHDSRLVIMLFGKPELIEKIVSAGFDKSACYVELEDLSGFQHQYCNWLLEQCFKDPDSIFTMEATEFMLTHAVTPLQINGIATKSLYAADRINQRPVNLNTVKKVMQHNGCLINMSSNGTDLIRSG